MKYFLATMVIVSQGFLFTTEASAFKRKKQDPKVKLAVTKALDYLAREQRSQGYWEANGGQYRVAMTALCGTALLAEGSTTTQGKYAKNIRRAVTWLTKEADPNSGLIGYPKDYRYTYGHGFSMLFLAQVYGEEEDRDRRIELKRVLTKAVEFSRNAQTNRGGWGYVSAKEGNQFDEGSTCITQVQGLRACRNAGIAVPKGVIDRAKKYIDDCTIKSGPQAGGIVYSISTRGGARPPITAASLAAMFNAGEYEGKGVKITLAYCKKYIWPGTGGTSYGHWHYAHYYYSQVMYRLGDKEWSKYINVIGGQIMRKQSASGAWNEGYIGPVYTTAINATILQLDKGFLPIYQR